jgi:hypothetical protein
LPFFSLLSDLLLFFLQKHPIIVKFHSKQRGESNERHGCSPGDPHHADFLNVDCDLRRGGFGSFLRSASASGFDLRLSLRRGQLQLTLSGLALGPGRGRALALPFFVFLATANQRLADFCKIVLSCLAVTLRPGCARLSLRKPALVNRQLRVRDRTVGAGYRRRSRYFSPSSCSSRIQSVSPPPFSLLHRRISAS